MMKPTLMRSGESSYWRVVCSLMGVYQNSLIFRHVSKWTMLFFVIVLNITQYYKFGWTPTNLTCSSVSLFTILFIMSISTIGEPQLQESLSLCGGPGKAFIRPGRLNLVSSNKPTVDGGYINQLIVIIA